MRLSFLKILVFSFLFCDIFSLKAPLYAQSVVERATRETDILGNKEKFQEKLRDPPPKPPERKIKEMPLREGGQKFFIKKINLIGCEYVSCKEFSPFLEKYENKEVTLADLETLAKELEREYLRQDIIAAVIVPAQDIKDQSVILQIIEAKMGELKIQGHKYFNKDRLNYYWKVPTGTIMRYDRIAKSIQMMNKDPDREVKAALSAGKKPGTTDVMLTSTTYFPVHATYSFDNEGTGSSGKKRVGYGIRHNNLFGLDDTFIGGATYGRSFGGTYFYHTVPINFDGTSILYGYSRSWSKPLMEFVTTGLKSEAVNSTFSLRQDLYQKDEYIGEAYFGFDAKDKVIKTNLGLVNRDRLRIFSLGTNLIKRLVGSSTSFSAEVGQGVSAFGASGHHNPIASRGAYPVFTTFNMGMQHRRALPYNLQANLRFKGQVAARKLPPQEEFGLGGIDSVRGYPASDYQADNALFTSAEILIPAFFIPRDWKIPYAEDTLKNQTTLLGFMDYGWGMRRGALATEKGKKNLLGIGPGVRFSLFNQALVRMEWGFPIGANNPTAENVRGRFHFSVDFEEKAPAEIARIRKIIEEEHIELWARRLINEELSRPDSPVRKKIEGYQQLVKIAEEKGNPEEVKIIKQKISSLRASLYRQAEEYVRSCIAQEKQLQQYCKLAEASYEEGNIAQAKQLWQKIVEEGSLPKPLIIEF